jgi:hypothetical protein
MTYTCTCEACGVPGPLRLSMRDRAALCGKCFLSPPAAWLRARREQIAAQRLATIKARATRARTLSEATA